MLVIQRVKANLFFAFKFQSRSIIYIYASSYTPDLQLVAFT